MYYRVMGITVLPTKSLSRKFRAASKRGIVRDELEFALAFIRLLYNNLIGNNATYAG